MAPETDLDETKAIAPQKQKIDMSASVDALAVNRMNFPSLDIVGEFKTSLLKPVNRQGGTAVERGRFRLSICQYVVL
jgi:hypothetical protein